MLVTMNAQQMADLLELVEPRVAVPIHFDDYTVFRSRVDDFVSECHRRGVVTELRQVDRGDTVSLVPGDGAGGPAG